MSERDQSPAGPRPGGTPDRPADWREQTTPGIPPVGTTPSAGAGGSTPGAGATGGPVDTGAHGPAGGGGNYYTTPQYSAPPVAVRRPDAVAALLLVLAGIAAAVSLPLRWLREQGDSGLTLVRRGFDDLGQGFGRLVDTGFWQPLAIVLGGGVLLILGLLMFVPTRTHRFLGVLALLVALLAAAGVLVVANAEDWNGSAFRTGFWFAVAVAGLGLLGALKAMLTGPRVR